MSLISEEGGHPSAISLSLSACPSRNAQWCQALIKCWHLTFRTETCTLFLPAQIWSLSCWGSFFLCCAPISDSWRIVLEPCWKNMAVWKVQRPYTENPKSTMLKLVYLSHFITVLFSRMCCRSALRGCPLAESKDKETVTFTVCHRAGNNAVTENAAGQGERDSCGRVRRLFF